MTENWITIDDVKVRHIWVYSNGMEIAVSPAWYEENGTPVDAETGDDCEYVRTEILIDGE